MNGEPRAPAPPERRPAQVIGSAGLGAYDLVSGLGSHGPPRPSPGQFYMLASSELWGGSSDERPYLPRAFSYARARVDPGGGAELLFLLEDVGPGTHRLRPLPAGGGVVGGRP